MAFVAEFEPDKLGNNLSIVQTRVPPIDSWGIQIMRMIDPKFDQSKYVSPRPSGKRSFFSFIPVLLPRHNAILSVKDNPMAVLRWLRTRVRKSTSMFKCSVLATSYHQGTRRLSGGYRLVPIENPPVASADKEYAEYLHAMSRLLMNRAESIKRRPLVGPQ